uniref:Uncharacterized protein n=1 Tax=Rousettus aegyptiacus TaxID=9407 RepID=A0A7J8KAM8_ROUAE|nr:hypothetical protein HJG63_007770 [Rousettus aegyptiacus]
MLQSSSCWPAIQQMCDLRKGRRRTRRVPPSLAGGEKHSTRPESQRHRRPGQEARVTASSDAILLPLRWPPPPLHWQVPWAPPLGLSTVTPLVPIGSIFYRSPHWPSCIQSCPTPTHPPEATESQSDPLKIYIRSHRLPAPVAACVWQGDSQDDLQCPPPRWYSLWGMEWIQCDRCYFCD